MRIEIHDDLKGAISIPVSRVVVYDKYDNPIAIAIQIDDNAYTVATVTQKAFPKLLKALGINKTVVVDYMDPKKLKSLD